MIGTPDDAIAQIQRLEAKQGEFGAFLQLAHNWATFENTIKSYDLWAEHVAPVFKNANVSRQASYDWTMSNAQDFMGQAMNAAGGDDPEARRRAGRQESGEGRQRRNPGGVEVDPTLIERGRGNRCRALYFLYR